MLKPAETLGVWFAQPILLDSSIAKDEWIEGKFEKYLSVLKPYKDVVGSTLGSLERNENNESLLGNLVTDSMLSVWNEAEVCKLKIPYFTKIYSYLCLLFQNWVENKA